MIGEWGKSVRALGSAGRSPLFIVSAMRTDTINPSDWADVDPSRTVAFTGHRSYKIYRSARGGSPDEIRQIITARTEKAVRLLYGQGYDTFVCGMAMGFDLWASCAVLSVKRDFPGIRLIAVIPFPDQDVKYSEADKILYSGLLDRADRCVCLYERYSSDTDYIDRNRMMLDHATMVVCYFSGGSGRSGTASTVSKARQRDMRILNICGHLDARQYNNKVDGLLIKNVMSVR